MYVEGHKCVRVELRLDFGEKTGVKLRYQDLIFAESLNVRVLFGIEEQTVVCRPGSVLEDIAQAHPLKIVDPVIFHIVVDMPNKDGAADVIEGQGLVIAQSIQDLSEHLC